MTILIAVAWLASVTLLLGITHRKALAALWRESVLSAPILIIESDDWAPGRDQQVQALLSLQQILSRFKDRDGHHPVMTVGLVLAIPDANRMRGSGPLLYHRRLLSAPEFSAILNAIKQGMRGGLFAPQLHGMEHYWPSALLARAQSDPSIRRWLTHEAPDTEALPSHLQSRWTDASSLPSRPIPDAEIQAAVAEEINAFETIVGERPQVVVPPTFVWNDATERAWTEGGIRVVVTPGARYEGRDIQGKLVPAKGKILNGESGKGGIIYVVRDDYFEPALGHTAEQVLAAIAKKNALGRPTLLETHRFNFTGEANAAANALEEFEKMLALVLQRFPAVRFMSTLELERHLRAPPSELRETRIWPRIRVWLVRIREIPRFWKLAKITGIALPLWLLSLLVRFAPQPGSHRLKETRA